MYNYQVNTGFALIWLICRPPQKLGMLLERYGHDLEIHHFTLRAK